MDDNSSPEIRLLNSIDRFGVAAVMGRPLLYANEARCMRIAESIVKGYRARARASNIATWHIDNSALAALLVEAQKLAEA